MTATLGLVHSASNWLIFNICIQSKPKFISSPNEGYWLVANQRHSKAGESVAIIGKVILLFRPQHWQYWVQGLDRNRLCSIVTNGSVTMLIWQVGEHLAFSYDCQRFLGFTAKMKTSLDTVLTLLTVTLWPKCIVLYLISFAFYHGAIWSPEKKWCSLFIT